MLGARLVGLLAATLVVPTLPAGHAASPRPAETPTQSAEFVRSILWPTTKEILAARRDLRMRCDAIVAAPQASTRLAALVRGGHFEDAIELVRSRPLPAEAIAPLIAALERRSREPTDAGSCIVVCDAIDRWESSDVSVTIAVLWSAIEATDDVEADARLLVHVGRRMASAAGSDPDRLTDALRTLTTAARLLAGSAHRDDLACAWSCIADRLHDGGRSRSAIALYDAVSTRCPGARDWARATFDAGLLQRATGRPRAAIDVLRRLFADGAPVNDADPSDLMRLVANYHHRAAIEISHAFEDDGRLDDAVQWMASANGPYASVSPCGNCRSSAARFVDREVARLRLLQKERKRRR